MFDIQKQMGARNDQVDKHFTYASPEVWSPQAVVLWGEFSFLNMSKAFKIQMGLMLAFFLTSRDRKSVTFPF